MQDFKFKPMKVPLPRRAEIRATLKAHEIEGLRPKIDMSDEDSVLLQCQEIAVKTDISTDELASYFYSLVFEADTELRSWIPYEEIYTIPRAAIREGRNW